MTIVDREAQELRVWPVWNQAEGFQKLAQYVCRAALRAHELVPETRPSRDDAAVARELFRRLQKQKLRYWEEPDLWQDGQIIRDPTWLLATGGNCMDFSTTYAAMCLQMGISPLLALTQTHAFAVLCPDRVKDPERDPEMLEPVAFAIDGARMIDSGVVQVEDPQALLGAIEARRLIAVDCVEATESGASFESAEASCRTRLQPGLILVDVLWLHSSGLMPPLAPAGGWPAIRRRLPGGAGDVPLFDGQRELINKLSTMTGTVAILGDSGIGKSTVGRRLVQQAPNGSGWFITAADTQALIDGLAEAELAQQGVTREGLERPDREALAQAALRRLHDSAHPWVVVLDNADGDPAKLARFLPRPGPTHYRQLVVITTTNAQWARPGVVVHPLGGATDDEILARLGTDRLTKLIGGRALLVDAFARLRESEPDALDRVDTDLDGPSAYWAVLRETPAVSGALDLCALASLMPPDHLPVDALEALADVHVGVERLAARGLFAVDARRGRARLHRLLGAAIRAGVAPEVLDHAALELTTDEHIRELMNSAAELPIVNELLTRLERLDDEATSDPESLNAALRGVGRMLEMRGDTERSAEAYARLRARLDPTNQEHREAYAECLHAAARVAYRNSKRERPLREALRDAEQAHELAAGSAAAGQYLAMRGLILKELAAFPAPGRSKAQLLRDALAILEDADALRAERLDELHPERVRSLFNLAGVRLPLAQAEPEAATEHLDAADAIYEEVASRRETIFGTRVHPQIAPCIQGQGLVAYYRALLVANTPADRSRHLRHATGRVIDALAQWHQIEIDQDAIECRKAVGYLAKIAMARHVHQLASASTVDFRALHRQLSELTVDVVEELRTEHRGL